jgi:pimeloyl-ACP methyl ester carboxylesterase
MFSILESPPPGARIDVVRAANSGPWGDEVRVSLETQGCVLLPIPHTRPLHPQVEARLTKLHAAGSVRIHVLEKAGHWVQMDNPSGLAKLMAPSFGLVK